MALGKGARARAGARREKAALPRVVAAAPKPSVVDEAQALADHARVAARQLAVADGATKDSALRAIASAIRDRHADILAANRADLATARGAGASEAILDRLALDEDRVEALAAAVEAVAALADPIGEVTRTWRRPNGIQVGRVRIPLGVILMIYEARPGVTTDAAALCLKSGNAVLLRGGSEALRSNLALGEAIAEGLRAAGLPLPAVQVVDNPDRSLTLELLKRQGQIDLAIPRGGESLIRSVVEAARVPVIQHYKGVCHLFVDETADLDMALRLAYDGKVSRPGVCNALETLLVHGEVAPKFLPRLGEVLGRAGVELRADPIAGRYLRASKPAVEDDWYAEYLDKILAVRVVADIDAALDHVARYGSQHTDAIVTRDLGRAKRWQREVDSSCVLVNASTRLNDGGELGLGAEIGISTTKLHAFGPMGLEALTAQKFVVDGDGQTRSSVPEAAVPTPTRR